MPERYVMFGHSGYFGDYCDAVIANGGILSRVVVNVGDPPGTKKPLTARLEEYNTWAEGAGHPTARLEQLDAFSPDPEETPVLGFRGKKLTTVRDHLHDTFGIEPVSLVHPTAYVSPLADLARCVFIGANATVASGVRLGDHAFINRCASIGHDCTLGPFTDIGPSGSLASGITTGESAVVGIAATVREDLTLGDGCLVAGASMVISDVAPDTLVAGVPAVFKKQLR